VLLTIVFGRAVQFFVALLTIRVSTSILPPGEMGRNSLIMAMIAVFLMVFISPVGNLINRKLHGWVKSGEVGRYMAYFFIYVCIVSVLSSWLSYFLLYTSISGVTLLTGMVIVGYMLCNTIFQTYIPSLNLMGDYKRFVIYTAIASIVGLVFSSLAVLFISRTAEYWLMGLLGGYLLVGVFGARVFHRQYSVTVSLFRSESLSFRPFIGFCLPLSAVSGCYWLQAQGYRFIAEEFAGLEALGFFVIGYGISAGLFAAYESVVVTYLQPKFYREVSEGDENGSSSKQAWLDYAFIMAPLSICVFALIVTSSGQLVDVLVADSYLDCKQFVIWGALAELLRILTGMTSLYTHARMDTKKLIKPAAYSGLLAIMLSILLVPELGLHGAGLAVSLAGMFGFILVQRHYLSEFFEVVKKMFRRDFVFSLMFITLSSLIINEFSVLIPSIIALLAKASVFCLCVWLFFVKKIKVVG
jgi:O-antigen/teichoic acid export membrane protein|tara:strand:+ start:4180 stop:5589 length:1410 start_codon:yes stop_codon:yes gene_type:complete